MRTIEPTKAPTDEVLAEVRRHKREIAEQHGFDVREHDSGTGTGIREGCRHERERWNDDCVARLDVEHQCR